MSAYFKEDEEFEDVEFTGQDFSEEIIRDVSFYNCTFERCSFQYANFAYSSFDACEFRHCNISLARLEATHVFDTRFTGCKLMGINWGSVRGLFKADFTDCMMDNTVFPDMKLQKFNFVRSSFNAAAFINADLTLATFDDCDLNGCVFDSSNLSQADLSSAYNYVIDSSINNLTNAKFSLPEAVSLLQNLGIVLV